MLWWIDMKSVVGVVLLDFSAAFDIIDHELLLMKLSAYGFKDSAIDLLKGYLVNRQQCVMFNGSLSNIETLQCGVPQGSCLGPLLYSIFVNDMPYVFKKKMQEWGFMRMTRLCMYRQRALNMLMRCFN